ncbi:arachidonate 12-lipoxygenase, 12R-type-like [Girardinichthys multiradiatus]|uniref:arachidonate 12-lipoxygenase, 12R-type-like n=1 Tax=Girardinichthys multiradiatus TaxID=208333 RepID=UPI001FAE4F15|nr:arachidonate 12-lipoxygenase, 12R-type-like [Girardinichthys multiradiatus]
MPAYEVTVYHSKELFACTVNNVYIKLVGEKGESEDTRLSNDACFIGKESYCTINCHDCIGNLLLIEIQKKSFLLEDNWFPEKIKVKAPNGKTYNFPMYTCITDRKKRYFKEGRALTVWEDCSPLGWSSRKQELDRRATVYCWKESEKGMPHHIEANDPRNLPWEDQFITSKTAEFMRQAFENILWEKYIELRECSDTWPDFDDISKLIDYSKYDILVYVKENWREDDFFGYQFLNGLNPILIRRCTALPDNFPVNENMISLHCKGSLAQEMKKGNIFLCDYKILDGVETRYINKQKQYLMAPLVLLHKTPDDKLMPIAIQLQQKPAVDNPIFLPTDSEYDWLLAKLCVRNADFNLFELNTHLLRTHLLAEVFAVSLLRNLPMVHPLYKLLVPHSHYTLHINVLARNKLISQDGVFTEVASSGGEGMIQILRRSLSSITYSSLCIPDDIAERGMKDIPNFFYRDDGLRLWDILHSFVEGILMNYYKSDYDVERDPELQKWIGDIFEHGFLCRAKSGIPQRFTTVKELVKFATMVIFTGSVQHAAVNSGQFDFGGWMPNLPSSIRCPPPTKKNEATEATILSALPDISTTIKALDMLYLLTRKFSDFVPFGTYPEDHFTEEEPRRLIHKFQEGLKELSEVIKERNKKLDVPYKYMDPAEVENSVAI